MSSFDSPIDILDDYPEMPQPSCQILGPTALVVQALLGIFAILSLVYKRHREKPKRPWRIWLFDVSKQVIGQMFIHGVNLVFSSFGSHQTSKNACVYYFLNIVIDTTLGVAIIYYVHHYLTYLASDVMGVRECQSGVYGNPPSFKHWILQAVVYVVSLLTMKLAVLLIFTLFPDLVKLGEWLLGWTWVGDGDMLQIIFTMGVFPIIMNIWQFWIIDSIVKASSPVENDEDDEVDERDRQPLFAAPDEDDESGFPRDVENSAHRPTSHHLTASPTNSQDEGSFVELENSMPQSPPLHSYPPNSPGTSVSPPGPSQARPSIIRSSSLKSSKRRSPPSPLHLQTVHQPAVNSPLVSSVQTRPTPSRLQPEPKDDQWEDSWEDSDDWAERVGEDEWTGTRMEQTKESLNAWAAKPTPKHDSRTMD